jgi:uncharacterized membrane protein
MTIAGGFDENNVASVVAVLVRLVESAGVGVIFVGAVVALIRFVVMGLRHRDPAVFVPVRLVLGRFLALGLEFQLAADILRTAVAPSFRELGQLAAVATIRTALNFFLGREIREERDQIARGTATGVRP